jgi:hypothetical protein
MAVHRAHAPQRGQGPARSMTRMRSRCWRRRTAGSGPRARWSPALPRSRQASGPGPRCWAARGLRRTAAEQNSAPVSQVRYGLWESCSPYPELPYVAWVIPVAPLAVTRSIPQSTTCATSWSHPSWEARRTTRRGEIGVRMISDLGGSAGECSKVDIHTLAVSGTRPAGRTHDMRRVRG